MDEYAPVVILETPFSPRNGFTVEQNIYYAQACMYKMLQLGEAPIAAHLLYTQVLDDHDEAERELGFKRSESWYVVADYVCVYKDLGITPGMQRGIEHAKAHGLGVVYRYFLHTKAERSAPPEEKWQSLGRLLPRRGHTKLWTPDHLAVGIRDRATDPDRGRGSDKDGAA